MSTQQDIYAAGSVNCPPTLNKDNYVPWSSRLLRYAKSKPNGKFLMNSIKNGPYVRRMIHEQGDPNSVPPVAESTNDQTYDELTEKELTLGIENVRNQNGLFVVPRIVNPNVNPNRNRNVVATRAEVRPRRMDVAYIQTQLLIAQKEEAGIQLQAEEFDLMTVAGDIDEIAEVNTNCILMLSMEHNGGTVEQHPAIVEETRAYFESLYNNLVTKVEKVNTVNRKMRETNVDLTTKLARYKGQEKSFKINKVKFDELETGVDNIAKTIRLQPRSNTKNDRVPSASKSSCIKNKDVKVEEHHRNLLLSKNKKHKSSECNNIKLAIRNDKSEVVCAMCKQCIITFNHDVCVLNYVNDMNSRDKKQNANVSNVANQKKHKPKFKKTNKVRSKECLASPKPKKPRTCLSRSPTGRVFDLKGKLIVSSESEYQFDSLMQLL
ncbi:hypothetical protein Tco_0778559 [Tanacetum coccineum]